MVVSWLVGWLVAWLSFDLPVFAAMTLAPLVCSLSFVLVFLCLFACLLGVYVSECKCISVSECLCVCVRVAAFPQFCCLPQQANKQTDKQPPKVLLPTLGLFALAEAAGGPVGRSAWLGRGEVVCL